MLYITTRNSVDTYTAARALQEERAPDGGAYMPYRLPELTQDEIVEMENKGFAQTVADLLNKFFSCRITSWDVEVSAGKNPVLIQELKQRTYVAELWHNPSWEYSNLEKSLFLVTTQQVSNVRNVGWTRIAIRVAVLFGLYAQLAQTDALDDGKGFDICVPTGDFMAAISVWYARHMGLPVVNILCGCNDNSAVWELLHIGEVHTDAPVVQTVAPLCDFAIPQELERLICVCCGHDEAERFAQHCAAEEDYVLPTGMLDRVRQGMFAAVVSSDRLRSLMPTVYSTTGYILGPYTALSYGALLDFRARFGGRRPALLLGDRSPLVDVATVSSAMGMTQSAVKEILGVI